MIWLSLGYREGVSNAMQYWGGGSTENDMLRIIKLLEFWESSY